jgi:DNA-binding PadR family transcriptional regulator
MSLRHVLLGFLNYGAMTGYELKKLFDVSVAHFWTAELSQIYPTLKRLEAEGLVEMEVEIQAERPNRKVYSITEDGHRELVEWLATPPPIDQMREPLLISLFFSAALTKEQIIDVLRQRVENLRHTLEEHRPAPGHSEQLAGAIGLQGEGFLWRLTVEAYLARLRNEIEWLEGAMAQIARANDAVFAGRRKRPPTMDVRKALRILDQHMGPGPHASARPVNGKTRRSDHADTNREIRGAAHR